MYDKNLRPNIHMFLSRYCMKEIKLFFRVILNCLYANTCMQLFNPSIHVYSLDFFEWSFVCLRSRTVRQCNHFENLWESNVTYQCAVCSLLLYLYVLPLSTVSINESLFLTLLTLTTSNVKLYTPGTRLVNMSMGVWSLVPTTLPAAGLDSLRYHW